MAQRDTILAYVFSFLLLVTRGGVYLCTPLLLDSLEPITGPLLNISSSAPLQPATPTWQKIDPLVQISVSMGVDSVLLGAALVVVLLCFPGQITARERSFPKRYLVIVGVTQSCSALMYQYSSPGERTPPYLQSFISNLTIPIVFLLRFILLHKRPTLQKTLCALVITVAGMVSLIPTFFPGLESKQAHQREGGATGAWRVIWPIIYIFQAVPHAISNIVLERSVKFTEKLASSASSDLPDGAEEDPGPPLSSGRSRNFGSINAPVARDESSLSRSGYSSNDSTQHSTNAITSCEETRPLLSNQGSDDNRQADRHRLNIVYTLFFTFTATFLGAVGLFWMDFIPGFGMQRDIHQFLPQVAFNFRCILGMAEVCGAVPITLAWLRMFLKTTSFIMAALVLRYGEGANFYALVGAITSPACFTFWALFQEHPFRWRPQLHLSTWLSMAAILVMFPAIVMYERGAPEVDKKTEVQRSEAVDPQGVSTRQPPPHTEQT